MRQNRLPGKPGDLNSEVSDLFDVTMDEWYEAKHRPPSRLEIDLVNSLEILTCPHCGSHELRRDGHSPSTGLLIRECKGCGRKFTPLTGTVFDSRKIPISEWFEFCAHLFQFHSVLSASADNRNAYSTGRYWISKVFLVLEDYQDDTVLSGRVFVDETYVPRWASDLVTRPDGSHLPGLSRNQICIASASASGRCYLAIAGAGKPSSAKVLKAYSGHIEPGSTLVHDGEKAHGALVEALCLKEEIHTTESTKGLSDREHPLDAINAVHRRLKLMLSRHHGYSREELTGWLNLLAFEVNTPGSPFEKARELVSLAVKKRSKLRYRTWAKSKSSDDC